MAKILVTASLLAIMSLFIALFDPFGFRTVSERASQDVVQFITSPFYARGFGARSPKAQDQITVVYIDESTLDRLKPLWNSFPPTYDNQAQLLDDVAGAVPGGPPRAIFADFIFLSKDADPTAFGHYRSAIADLTKAQGTDANDHKDGWIDLADCQNDEVIKLACIEAAHGTPIILGGDKTRASLEANSGLADLAKVAVIGSLKVNERAYPLLGERDSPAALLYVDYCLNPGAARDCHDPAFGQLREAAQGLLAQWNETGPAADDDASASAAAEQAADQIRKHLAGRFAVRWSARPDMSVIKPARPDLKPQGAVNDLSRALTGKPSPCPGADPDANPLIETWADAAGRVLQRLTPWRVARVETGGDGDQSAPPAPPCPYALSVSYGDLVNGPTLSDRAPGEAGAF